jgi:exonuclease SbcD
VNNGHQPPVIYPGSIERVDFGEVKDEKFFVIATIESGHDTQVEWRPLSGRRFIDRHLRLSAETGEDLAEVILNRMCGTLGPQDTLSDAVVRLVVEYPAEWEPLLNEQALRHYAEPCFEFHFVRRPLRDARIRLPADAAIASLTPMDLLDVYWRSLNASEDESRELQSLARQVIGAVSGLPE